MKKFRRLKTLGEGYSEEEIKVRITKEDLKSYRRSEIIGAPRSIVLSPAESENANDGSAKRVF